LFKINELFNSQIYFKDNLDKFVQKFKMPLKAIIFDFDLTLADATKGIYQCMNHALSHFGYPMASDETIKKTIGHPISESFKMLTGNHNPETAKDFMSVFVAKADEIMNKNTFVYPHVYQILPQIKNMGINTAIVSTKYRYRINGILERENLDKFIDYVVGGEDVKSYKPNPEGLFIAIEKLGVSKKEVLYIGDSIVDAEAAQNADVKFCAVLTGSSTREEFNQLKTNYIINQLNELDTILHLDL
jgi:phosphoglycolate phosphatase